MYVIQPIFHEGSSRGTPRRWRITSSSAGSARVDRRARDRDLPGGAAAALLKLYEAGRENETVMRIIEKNTRQPIEVIGDLRARSRPAARASAA